MKTEKFNNFIQEITGRNLIVRTNDVELQLEKEYYVSLILPITKICVGFYWKLPKKEDNIMRSFITAFSSKYFEPDPKSYDGSYFGSKSWDDMTEKDKERCYMHHRSNMYSRSELLSQIEKNFEKENFTEVMCKYGFYHTNYGIGMFCYFNTEFVRNAIEKFKVYLTKKGIPFSNEYSDARWVYRFVLGLDKQKHESILEKFNKDE